MVSVIVLNYNGRHILKECFESLQNISYANYETILVDNASTDDSVEFVAQNFPRVKILVLDKNYDFAKGNNKGAEFAKGKYVAFLNNDTEVDKEWLTELVSMMEGDRNVAACGSKMLFWDDRSKIDFGGVKLTFIGNGAVFSYGEEDDPEAKDVEITAAPCGGAMLIDKEIFLDIGGFDPDYIAFSEDLDLGWRLWLSGYKVYFVPKSVVYHKGGVSWQGLSQRKIYLIEKNNVSNIIKHFEAKNTVKGILIHSAWFIVKLLMLLRNGDLALMKAMVKGVYQSLKELPQTMMKRKMIQQNRKLSDRDLLKSGLLMGTWEGLRFFLHRHRG
jgi:GT2 family glycosyltransferase